MGFCSVLSLILVVAKILSLVTFSWWICLAPFLIGFGMKILILLVVFLIGAFSNDD